MAAEIISNSDGTKKQDCELNAGKRWLCAHGDDLYANRPFCEKIIEQGMSFIFTCKEDYHPRLSETLQNSYIHEVKETKWDARKKKHIQVHMAILQRRTDSV